MVTLAEGKANEAQKAEVDRFARRHLGFLVVPQLVVRVHEPTHTHIVRTVFVHLKENKEIEMMLQAIFGDKIYVKSGRTSLGPKTQFVHWRDQVKKAPTDFRTICVLEPSEALKFYQSRNS